MGTSCPPDLAAAKLRALLWLVDPADLRDDKVAARIPMGRPCTLADMAPEHRARILINQRHAANH